LSAALSVPSAHVTFVGSKAKAAAIGEKLRAKGVDEGRLAALKAPAGLDIGAITPDEIALSILAEITQIRRAGSVRGRTRREARDDGLAARPAHSLLKMSLFRRSAGEDGTFRDCETKTL
jgi:xanthine dehydrogenase accessory factor